MRRRALAVGEQSGNSTRPPPGIPGETIRQHPALLLVYFLVSSGCFFLLLIERQGCQTLLLQPAAAVLSQGQEMLSRGAALPRHQRTHALSPLRGAGTLLAPSLGPRLSPAMGKGKAGEPEKEAAALRLSCCPVRWTLKTAPDKQAAVTTQTRCYPCALRSQFPPSLTGLWFQPK